MSEPSDRHPEVEVLSGDRKFEFVEGWYELGNPSHFWFQWRFAAALKLIARLPLDPQAPARVLEVGCGHGVLRAQFEHATAWVIDGCDLDADALARMPRGRGRNLYYDIRDRREDLAARYDLLVLFDVLEHIGDPVGFLDACRFHLRPGGLIFINVPSLRLLHSEYDEVVGHLRRYTTPTLSAEVVAGGFEVLTSGYWALSMIPVLLLRKAMLAMLRHRPVREKVSWGFDPPHPVVHTILKLIMRVELTLPLAPPAGTSLLQVARRPV